MNHYEKHIIENLKYSSPSDIGMNTKTIDGLVHRIKKKEKITNLLIIRNNNIVLDYYKSKRYINKNSNINSCTKSIISTLFGIAMKQNLISDIHQPISNFFPRLHNYNIDKRKKDITIYHLLNMTCGIDWPEFGEWNYMPPMVYDNSWIDFILARPMSNNPGKVFNYNSGCSHLLSAIIQKVSNIDTYDFAKKHLFKPLNIKDVEWKSDPDNIYSGGFGIRMSVADMSKIGLLYLHKGKWSNKQIVSKDWINETFKVHSEGYKDIGSYGFQWWNREFIIDNKKIKTYFALGYGGQYIFVVPELNLVASFLSNNYRDILRPMYYLKNYILNSVVNL